MTYYATGEHRFKYTKVPRNTNTTIQFTVDNIAISIIKNHLR